MKLSEQKCNAYQLLLWDQGEITEEKRMWMSILEIKEGNDKLRKSLFREVGELKKKNRALEQEVWKLKQSMNEQDMFEDFFVMAK